MRRSVSAGAGLLTLNEVAAALGIAKATEPHVKANRYSFLQFS